MKTKLMGLAALLLITMTVIPVSAQAKVAGARKVTLKEKHEAGIVITENSTENMDGKIAITVGGQQMDGSEQTKGVEETTTEILALGADGEVSEARVTYVKDANTKSEQKPGAKEVGDPVESKGDLEGVVIHWAFDATTKAWTSKLERSDPAQSESKDVLKALKKKQPFANPFIPGKEVAVGDAWEVTEAELKAFFGEGDDDFKVKEAKATCKLEEIVTVEGKEQAKVSFVINVSATGQNQNLGELDITMANTGHYMFDLTTSRTVSVEMNPEVSFEKEVETEQGKIKVGYKATGKEVKLFTYAKAEKKEGSK